MEYDHHHDHDDDHDDDNRDDDDHDDDHDDDDQLWLTSNTLGNHALRLRSFGFCKLKVVQSVSFFAYNHAYVQTYIHICILYIYT